MFYTSFNKNKYGVKVMWQTPKYLLTSVIRDNILMYFC